MTTSMATPAPLLPSSESLGSRDELVATLRELALIIGKVTLSSGAEAEYLVDAKRAILTPIGFRAVTRLVGEQALDLGATAVGGESVGADPIVSAALASGLEVNGFFVRKEVKRHGLSRSIEGPALKNTDRCLIVDDVVTTGASTIRAIEAVQKLGIEVCGVVAVCDRLAGGAKAIEAAARAPFRPLTTIDEVYPDRPDRR